MASGVARLRGYALGLVPVGVAVVFGVLCIPRTALPEDVPVPAADPRELARVRAADHLLAEGPRPLPDDVRVLGTALRTYNEREAKQGIDPYVTPERMNEARVAIDQALSHLRFPDADGLLLALRATQLEAFVAQVRAFEATGAVSPDLEALGGRFVERMRDVGWCAEKTCSFDEEALRAMFKLAWNALARTERIPFELALDEERALYAFYLRHPHAPEATRKRIDEARAGARTERACASLAEAERQATEKWRLDKMKRLGEFDRTYPLAYARGIALYRHHDFQAAAESFRDWLDAHPDGPWTLRARNYLRASLAAVIIE